MHTQNRESIVRFDTWDVYLKVNDNTTLHWSALVHNCKKARQKQSKYQSYCIQQDQQQDAFAEKEVKHREIHRQQSLRDSDLNFSECRLFGDGITVRLHA